jgi:hypothetical protein
MIASRIIAIFLAILLTLGEVAFFAASTPPVN